MPALLDPDAVATALAGLEGWDGDVTGITRRIECSSFRSAVTLLDAIADAAEAADHHPDLDLRYDRLVVSLATHSAGGVTELDLALAREVDVLAARLA